MSTDQNLVRVAGAESIVNRVDSAVINIDMSTLSEFTSDITTSVPVRLYDAEGNEVEGSTLTRNPENVMITIEILSTKDVPLRFEVEGDPAEGFGLTGVVASDVQTVKIAGRRSALNACNEIVIPPEAIDVSEISEDMTTKIDICDYLPENVILADKSGSMPVNVTVGVERETTTEYTLRSEDVRLLNIPEGLECRLDGLEEEYTVELTGIRSAMGTVGESGLEAVLDVAAWAQEQGVRELIPGRYLATLQFNNPEYTRVDRPVTATLIVSGVTGGDEEE